MRAKGKGRIEIICKQCGILKVRYVYRYTKYAPVFCSYKCHGLSNKGIGFMTGRKHTEKSRKKMSLHSNQKGENNNNWKGNKVGYLGLHQWVKRNLIKPQVCKDCNQPKSLDLANISGKYKRDLSDWKWLCRSCHKRYDFDNGLTGKTNIYFDKYESGTYSKRKEII